MNKISSQIKSNSEKLKSNIESNLKLQARTHSQQARKNLKNLSKSSVRTLTMVAYQHDKYNKQVRQIQKGNAHG